MNKTITTIIPTYFDSGIPINRFMSCLESIRIQTVQPKKIVLTDDSVKINFEKEILPNLPNFGIPIEYVKNPNNRGMGSNSNFGLKFANSYYVHILHSDDCLNDEQAYEKMISEIIECPSGWIFSGGNVGPSFQTPILNEFLIFGVNTLGGPSGLFAKRDNYLDYDTELKMLVDVEHYSRMISKFGPPGIINQSLLNYGVGPWQVQNNTSSSEIFLEYKYLLERYPGLKEKLMRLENTTKDLEIQVRIKKLNLQLKETDISKFVLIYYQLIVLFFKRALRKIKRLLG